MNIVEIRKLFPVKAKITAEIIQEADLESATHCIGALTLKSILPEDWHEDVEWHWFKFGRIGSWTKLFITTKEKVNMLTIKEPRVVTFIIKTDLDWVLGA